MDLNDNSYNVKYSSQLGRETQSLKKQAVNNLFSRLRLKALSTIIIILISKIIKVQS